MAKAQRVGLSLFDRGVLLVAWSITSALVYLLGFYVGKGTQEGPIGGEQRVVGLPVTSKPPPEGQQPKTASPFDFYGHLGDSGRGTESGPVVAKLPEPPPAAPPTMTIPAPPLAKTAPTPPPAPRPAPPPTAAEPPVARPPSRTGESPPNPAVSRSTPPPPPRAADADSEHASAAVATPPTPMARGGAWTVEVNPTRSLEEIESLQAQLRRRGYETTVVKVPRGGDIWYRLRVGRYATSEQATQAMHRLRAQEGVTRAFVASE